MTTTYELPKVGEPAWVDTHHDLVSVEGFTYDAKNNYDVDLAIANAEGELARWLVVKQFMADQVQAMRDDCAGERAYMAFTSGNPFDPIWEKLPETSRAMWIRAAKAVLSEG